MGSATADPDGSISGRPGPKPGRDGSDGIPDAGEQTVTDGGALDAQVLFEDAGTDSGVQPALCAETDIQAWQMFHQSQQLVSTIDSCSKMLVCKPGMPCALDVCLLNATGMKSCDSCVSHEVSCVANNCQKPCSDSDEACRACACAAGCVGMFESCAGRGMNVCTYCEANPGQCGGSQLSPELIMVIVAPLI